MGSGFMGGQTHNGRDHNPHGFTMWLAGGGIKGGMTFGATDDFGWKAVDKPVHVHDIHATILYHAGNRSHQADVSLQWPRFPVDRCFGRGYPRNHRLTLHPYFDRGGRVERMKAGFFKYSMITATISLTGVLAISSAFAAKPQVFVGTIGDAVCGSKHTMDGDDISCLRTCIQRGSKYDLVVGDKVFVLNVKDQTSADVLDKLASQQAKAQVKGAETSGVIDVESVAPVR